ncbi:MAG TPA: hypothetical protein VNL91_02560 [Thermoanaerobaculia bacterium]|nr:hypothetical protein [Thermoanaerobaculia bacterium]
MSDAPSPPWRPGKFTAWFLGIASIWPPVYFFLFFAGFVSAVFWTRGERKPPFLFDVFEAVMVVHVLTMFAMFGVIIALVVHAFRSDRLAPDRRLLWVVVLILGGFVAGPVYWWFYVRPGANETAGPPDMTS